MPLLAGLLVNTLAHITIYTDPKYGEVYVWACMYVRVCVCVSGEC